jgi:hypothetical protein
MVNFSIYVKDGIVQCARFAESNHTEPDSDPTVRNRVLDPDP